MYIKARVFPESRREKLIKKRDHFEVYVREKAVRNLANVRTQSLLADYFKVSSKSVRLLTGHRSQGKIFSIDEDFIK